MDKIVKAATDKMKKALEHTLHEFSALHTGKASPGMVENVMVNAYGSMMPLKQMAAITTPDHRMISIQPWDNGMTEAIAKAIRDANLGLNPIPEGSRLIRVPIPELSRERRQDFVKTASKMAEQGKVVVRNIRRDANEEVKNLQKNKVLTEDDVKVLEKQIQAETDKFIADIDNHLKHKEKELMQM